MRHLDDRTRRALTSATRDVSLGDLLADLARAIEEDAANAPDEVLYSATARTGPLLARARRGLTPRPRKGD